MIGLVFNSWRVLSEEPQKSRKYGRCFLCECVCGNRSVVREAKLKGNESTSCRPCGQARQRLKVTRHGLTYTPVWRSWHAMMTRTAPSPAHSSSRKRAYIDRRIRVVPPLDVFEEFHKHMGDRPKGKTLDRIDNNLGYEIGNLRWATPKEQTANRQCTRLITFRGKSLMLCEWAKRLNMTPEGLSYRLSAWPLREALTTPNLKNLSYNNLID